MYSSLVHELHKIYTDSNIAYTCTLYLIFESTHSKGQNYTQPQKMSKGEMTNVLIKHSHLSIYTCMHISDNGRACGAVEEPRWREPHCEFGVSLCVYRLHEPGGDCQCCIVVAQCVYAYIVSEVVTCWVHTL